MRFQEANMVEVARVPTISDNENEDLVRCESEQFNQGDVIMTEGWIFPRKRERARPTTHQVSPTSLRRL
jgi:hypothetical protein